MEGVEGLQDRCRLTVVLISTQLTIGLSVTHPVGGDTLGRTRLIAATEKLITLTCGGKVTFQLILAVVAVVVVVTDPLQGHTVVAEVAIELTLHLPAVAVLARRASLLQQMFRQTTVVVR